MSNAVRAINLVDFTGGLNLRGDAFELAEGESPDMLNVDLDGRGGFVSRKGWSRWNTSDVVAGTWDPRTLFVHELANGTDRVFLANNNKVYRTTDGITWTVLNSTTDIVAGATPHDADFAPWGDVLYVACGNVGTDASVRVDAALTVTRLTQAEGGNFSTYASPTVAFPYANFVAPYSGFMFAASTEESGVKYPNRVRWSHPQNPEAWATDDYIDIAEGGGPITGLIPMRDHLLVFKQSQVWAIFGYDADSFQPVNVSRELGAPHRQAIARSENAVFFYAHSRGVYAIANGEAPTEVSSSLRPMFSSSTFNNTVDKLWLGWVGQRLWFSCPWEPTVAPTQATSVFVFDPSVGDGAWVYYRSTAGMGIGPFAQGGFGGGAGLKLGCTHTNTAHSVLRLEDNDLPVDNLTGTPLLIDSYYVTRWIDGGTPTLKKMWRRPDIVMKERSLAYTAIVEVFHDYNEADAARTKLVGVDSGGSGATWNGFVWGDGTIFGPAARGSRIERGGTLGAARAVQLRFTGEQAKPWGVDAIVFKYIPRRMR